MKIRLAYLDGVKTTAKKVGRQWLVGGDFVQPGDKVQIAALFNDSVWGVKRWSWHTLKGCFLKFDDYLTEAEIAEMENLNKAKEA